MAGVQSTLTGLNNFKIIKWINCSTTALIQHKQTHDKCVVKVRSTLLDQQKYEEEKKVLSSLSDSGYHTQFYASFSWNFGGDWGLKQCLIFKFEEKGNLRATIVSASRKRKGFTKMGDKADEKQIIVWVRQIIQGLLILPEHKEYHRDLNIDNIFLDCKNAIKISEPGMTKEIEEDKEKKSFKGNVQDLVTIILDLLTKKTDFEYPRTSLENRIELIPQQFSDKWKIVISKLMNNNNELTESELLKEVDSFLVNFEVPTVPTTILSTSSKTEDTGNDKFDHHVIQGRAGRFLTSMVV